MQAPRGSNLGLWEKGGWGKNILFWANIHIQPRVNKKNDNKPPFVPGDMLLVAGLPREPLGAEAAVPGGPGPLNQRTSLYSVVNH